MTLWESLKVVSCLFAAVVGVWGIIHGVLWLVPGIPGGAILVVVSFVAMVAITYYSR